VFTGIISSRGRVVEVRPGQLGIDAPGLARKLGRGGSIAVNGACLTVVETEGDVFFVDVVPETFRRTNLGGLAPGDEVNLEPPLRLDQGLDGHLVQGHIDAAANVQEVREVDVGWEIEIELPASLGRHVAEKGSIAVDGASLTVAAVNPGSFRVALIPHTLRETIAGTYHHGTVVNLEVDVVARYVERLIGEGRV
jgi:riboflavin synthase